MAYTYAYNPNTSAQCIVNDGTGVTTARTITASTGLSGGGDLSADRTISLAATTVSAGSYTQTSLTVDAQGRITAASNGKGLRPLFDHFVDAGNLTTGETDLYSDSIPAAQLGTNGDKLEAEYGGNFVSSGTATRQVKLYFGGTAIFDSGALSISTSASWSLYLFLIRVSASVVRYAISLQTSGAALTVYAATGELTGLTLANANILKVTGQAGGVGAATNDIVAKLGTVSFISAA